jgi:hypothetical protein
VNKNGTLNEHKATESALEERSGGNHYLDNAIQPIEYLTAKKLNFIDGNIVKYATRKKDGETDKERYDKIIHYAKLGKELL